MGSNDNVQDVVEVFATASVVLIGLAAVLLWLGDRPGDPIRWRLTSASALAAAGLGLLANQAIGHVWFRERPFAAHPGDTVLLAPPSPDPSFPSDHATAAFAIAFAVLFFSRSAGVVFLAAALSIGLSRIFLGLHYPGDIAAGAVVGCCAAAATVVLAHRPMAAVVRLASRVTDPLVGPLWSLLTRLPRGGRGSPPPAPGADSP